MGFITKNDYLAANHKKLLTIRAWTNVLMGAIEALEAAGITQMPIITGQDNTATAQRNIKDAKQAMTIDKNLNDMAYNTAMIINSLVAGSPVQASRSISNGGVTIPAFFSKVSLVTIDSISW